MAIGNGFQLSSSKTVGMQFCNKRGIHPEPELKLYNSFIKIDPEMFRSPFFSKLTFLPHIKMLKISVLQQLS